MSSSQTQIVATPSDRFGVRSISLNQPRRRNALSLQMRRELRTSLRLAMDDAECRVIVITGTGGYFCSGGDLTETSAGGAERFEHLSGIVHSMVAGAKPVVAAVEGGAYGVGLSLVAAADLVVSSREATFGCSFVKVGLSCDGGASWTLPRRIGLARARRLLLTGDVFTADDAAQWGIVDYLAPSGEAMSVAREVAVNLAQSAPLAVQGLKRLLNTSSDTDLATALDGEATTQSALVRTEDCRQAVAAFLDRRTPAPFTGK